MLPMKILPVCLLLLALPLPFWLSAQTEKGASPIPTQNSTLKTQNSTWAVVVGISDYQDEDIPDLRFAHRDAEAFANFLRSPAGGALDGVRQHRVQVAGKARQSLPPGNALSCLTKSGLVSSSSW